MMKSNVSLVLTPSWMNRRLQAIMGAAAKINTAIVSMNTLRFCVPSGTRFLSQSDVVIC